MKSGDEEPITFLKRISCSTLAWKVTSIFECDEVKALEI